MSDRPNETILRLKEVSLQATVGSDYLIRDISLAIEAGENVAIVGTSGSGKTSLLRAIDRLVIPQEGEIYFQGATVERLTAIELRRKIVLVTQEPKLLGMNVIDALSYPLRLQQLTETEIRQRVDTWIDLLGIAEEWLNKTELQLSLGQRQLIAIARALVMRPQILLLDEPTSALDIGTATRVLSVLTELNQSQNLTILIVSHQLDLIENFCDRIIYLSNGKIEADLPANKSNWKQVAEKLIETRSQDEREWS